MARQASWNEIEQAMNAVLPQHTCAGRRLGALYLDSVDRKMLSDGGRSSATEEISDLLEEICKDNGIDVGDVRRTESVAREGWEVKVGRGPGGMHRYEYVTREHPDHGRYFETMVLGNLQLGALGQPDAARGIVRCGAQLALDGKANPRYEGCVVLATTLGELSVTRKLTKDETWLFSAAMYRVTENRKSILDDYCEAYR